MNVFQIILAFLNTDPLQNFRVTQPKAIPKADHLLLLLPIISEQKAKGWGRMVGEMAASYNSLSGQQQQQGKDYSRA